jgi:hypothetical protein
VLAETKDHADWELLGKIVRQTTDSRLREVLGPAVDTVEQEEDEHLNWTRKKLADLQMEALTKAVSVQPKSTSGGPSASSAKKRTQAGPIARSSGTAGKSRAKPAAVTAKRRRRTAR